MEVQASGDDLALRKDADGWNEIIKPGCTFHSFVEAPKVTITPATVVMRPLSVGGLRRPLEPPVNLVDGLLVPAVVAAGVAAAIPAVIAAAQHPVRVIRTS